MTAGTRIDDGGKVPGEIVGIAAIGQRKSKGYFQGDLRAPDDFPVAPSLTVNRDLTSGSSCIQERFAISSESHT